MNLEQEDREAYTEYSGITAYGPEWEVFEAGCHSVRSRGDAQWSTVQSYVEAMRIMQNCLVADPEQQGMFTRRAIQGAQEAWNALDFLFPLDAPPTNLQEDQKQ